MNKFLLTEKYLKGVKTEELFIRAIMYNDSTTEVSGTTTEQNRNGIDYFINDVPIDVKGRKNIGILNSGSDKYTILEIKDSAGKDGWLLKAAKYIAFHRHYAADFVIVSRLELLAMYRSIIKDDTEWSLDHNPNDSIGKRHRRVTNDEEVTTVSFEDIFKYCNPKVVKLPRYILTQEHYKL